MNIGRVAASLGAAIIFCLAGCNSPRPHIILSGPAAPTVPAKTRLYVVEDFFANFGGNEGLFRERLRTLAQSCGATIDFFVLPPRQGQLALDSPIPHVKAALDSKVADFKPDGILEVRTVGWNGNGALPNNPAAQLLKGSFSISVRLLDGNTRAEQWRAQGNLDVDPDSGGDWLASEIIRKLARAGALPGCPLDLAAF